MTLSTPCRSCQKKLPIKPTKGNRTALSKKIGVTFLKQCDGCGEEHEYHVKQVTARMRPTPIIIFGVISVLSIFFMYSPLNQDFPIRGVGYFFIPPLIFCIVFVGVIRAYCEIAQGFNFNKRERGKWD